MVISMTGFGRGAAQDGTTAVTVELRTVNNRFIEFSSRLPRDLSDREPEIQALLRQALSRGRINVLIQVERGSQDEIPIDIDETAARGYARLLERLRSVTGIAQPVGLEHLLTFSDVFKTADQESGTSDELWALTQTALGEAIRNLVEMRRREGESLRADLLARIELIAEELAAVRQRAPERVVEARERLKQRLEEILQDERILPERIELEITMLADRLDVTEECVRLDSHLQVFREAIDAPEPAGRKLNFLVQEMNREVNTIGSKSNDAAVAHRVVQMKEELERIREQIQNIE